VNVRSRAEGVSERAVDVDSPRRSIRGPVDPRRRGQRGQVRGGGEAGTGGVAQWYRRSWAIARHYLAIGHLNTLGVKKGWGRSGSDDRPRPLHLNISLLRLHPWQVQRPARGNPPRRHRLAPASGAPPAPPAPLAEQIADRPGRGRRRG
jgi:hypothetical protein